MKTDKGYEYDINALIPMAEKEARTKVALFGKKNERRAGFGADFYNHCFFTQFFHEAMLKLGIKNGLRSF